MSARPDPDVAWWLSLEPVGADAVWALTRVEDGTPPEGPVGAGLLPGIGFVRDLVRDAVSGAGTERAWKGSLTDPDGERLLACTAGRVLLPYVLRKELVNAPPGSRHIVSIAVRGWLAQVPWDSLAVDDDGNLRLVECATVVGGLAATLHVGRARLPDRTATGPAVRVIDPGPAAQGRLCPQGTGAWWARCRDDEDVHPLESRFDGDDLGRVLRSGRPARFLYYGHATAGTAEAPAAAALILRTAAQEIDNFTAFRWLREPDRFPAPPRVGLVACASDDSEQDEQSGMPVAAINAGAGLVTATRWRLPVEPGLGDRCPTMALAMAVDEAHARTDAIAALRHWQIDRLRAWRAGGARRDTPLLWASLVSYLAPARLPT